MSPDERDFVRWLSKRCNRSHPAVALGIGDDMAILNISSGRILITSDMLLDGVHFQSTSHTHNQIGYKAAACSLSDCAAMATQPTAAVISLSLPRTASLQDAQSLLEAFTDTCDAFGCPVVGGDTTSWNHPLAIDVSMISQPYPGIEPIRRDGAAPGDTLFVTGGLGGSLLSKHLNFTPRVNEAKKLAQSLGNTLHAMLDVSDGLAIDVDRLAEASGIGVILDEQKLLAAASEDAAKAATIDGASTLAHVLGDGEDFELLIAAAIDETIGLSLGLLPVGEAVTTRGLWLRGADGKQSSLPPKGYQHL